MLTFQAPGILHSRRGGEEVAPFLVGLNSGSLGALSPHRWSGENVQMSLERLSRAPQENLIIARVVIEQFDVGVELAALFPSEQNARNVQAAVQR